MDEPKSMREVREIAETYMQLCVKCGHTGLVHQKEDHRDQSRQRKIMGEFGECQKCKSENGSCKQYVPPKEKK